MPVSLLPISPWAFVGPQLVIVAGVIVVGLVYFYRSGKKLPAWFKGGLIAIAVTLLISLFFMILASTVLSGGMYRLNDMWGSNGTMLLILTLLILPIFVLGLIIGNISGKVLKQEKTFLTKYFKVGFILGAIISVGLLLIELYYKVVMFQRPFYKETAYAPVPGDYINLTYLLILFIIPFAAAWIFWIIGSLVRKHVT